MHSTIRWHPLFLSRACHTHVKKIKLSTSKSLLRLATCKARPKMNPKKRKSDDDDVHPASGSGIKEKRVKVNCCRNSFRFRVWIIFLLITVKQSPSENGRRHTIYRCVWWLRGKDIRQAWCERIGCCRAGVQAFPTSCSTHFFPEI